MVQLDKDAVEEFKEIYYAVYGKELSDEEAKEQAMVVLMYLLSAKESFDMHQSKN